jgi:hypothetical protein
LLAIEERRTAEQRSRNSDDMLNREEGMLMACWTEKKESWWHVKKGGQLNREEGKLMTSEESRKPEQRRRKEGKLMDVKKWGQMNREEGSWWQVKRVEQLNREEGKLMASEEKRTAKQKRRKADG